MICLLLLKIYAKLWLTTIDNCNCVRPWWLVLALTNPVFDKVIVNPYQILSAIAISLWLLICFACCYP